MFFIFFFIPGNPLACQLCAQFNHLAWSISYENNCVIIFFMYFSSSLACQLYAQFNHLAWSMSYEATRQLMVTVLSDTSEQELDMWKRRVEQGILQF